MTTEEYAAQAKRALDEQHRRAKEYVDAVFKPNETPYFETEDANEARSKVVKVSTVIVTMAYMQGIVATRILPSWWKEKIEEIISKRLAAWVAEMAASFVPGPGWLGRLLRATYKSGTESEFEKVLEQRIRDELHKVRVDFQALALNQFKSGRQTKDVRTRHNRKRKRQQNPWKSR